MATMKQVAERAGVSISTVSHVINNTRAVSDDVRRRVLGIIDEMRYVPSAVARSLKNDKTNTIGVLVPNGVLAVWRITGNPRPARLNLAQRVAVDSTSPGAGSGVRRRVR